MSKSIFVGMVIGALAISLVASVVLTIEADTRGLSDKATLFSILFSRN